MKSRPNPFLLPARFVAALAITLSANSAHAATVTWSAATGADWDTGTNWTGLAKPLTADTALFNLTGITSVANAIADQTITGINFDTAIGSTGAFTLGTTGGNKFTLQNNGTIQILSTLTGTGKTITVNAPLVLAGTAYTFSNANTTASNTLNFGGAITSTSGTTILTLNGANTGNNTIGGNITNGASGTMGLTKSGTGTWVLSGNNTYTGRTTVTGGLLRLDSSTALSGASLLFNGGVGTGGVIGLTAATGDFTRSIGGTNPGAGQVGWTSGTTGGFAAFGGNRSVNFGGAGASIVWSNGSGILGAGLILGHSTSDSTVTVVNPIDLNTGNGRTVQVDDGSAAVDAILGGVISGTTVGAQTSSLLKTGSGTLQLTANNTYTGFTTISAGTLQVGNGGTTGTLGTLSVDSAITNNGTLVFNRSDTVTQGTNFANIISGTGNLTQAGSGTLVLSGVNTYTGTTTVSAGTLTIGGAGQLNSGSYSGNISNAGTFIHGSSANQTLSGIISGAGILTKSGTGTLTLSGANTYTGRTTVSGGVLRLDHATALPGGVATAGGTSSLLFNGGVIGLTTATGDFTRSIGSGGNPGATQVGWTTTTGTGGFAAFGGNRSVNFGGAGASVQWSGSGGVFAAGLILGHSTSDSTVTVVNPIDLNTGSGRTVRVDDGSAAVDAILAGVLSGTTFGVSTSSLVKTGSGTLQLTANNTYTGFTTISAGTLQVGNGGTTGTLGTLSVDSAITNNGTLVFNRSDTVTQGTNFANIISGTGNLTQVGSGTLVLSGVNTYTGATTVSVGTLTIGGAGQLNSGSYSGNISNAGTFIHASSANQTISGIISGAGILTKSGTGTLTLSGANTYTGRTTVSGGVLRLDHATALPGGVATAGGTSSLLFNGAGSAGGVIGLTTATGDFTRSIVGNNPGATQVGWTTGTTGGFAAFGGDRSVNFGGAGASVQWGNGSGVFAAGLILGHSTSDSTVTVVNPIDLNTGNGIRIVQVDDGSAAVDAILAGAISGIDNAGNLSTLTKTGLGTLRLSNTNTYFGHTIITQGTLQVGAVGAISNGTGVGNVIFDVAANTALLDINGFDSTINGLSQATPSTTNKVVNNATGTNKTLTVGNANATSTFAGIIADNTSGTGTLALTKIGTGTLTLTGTNTYSGVTAVSQGKLIVGVFGGGGSLTSNVTVASGATVGGSGTITGTATISSGGTLAAGNSPGTLTVTGTSTFNNGSIFSWDISSDGTSYDKLITSTIAGEVTAGDAVFQIVASDASFADNFWDTNRSWADVVTTNGSSAISNWTNLFTIAVVDSGFNTITPVGGSFSVSGSSINWTAVPEPTSALAGLMIGAGLLRRRRTA